MEVTNHKTQFTYIADGTTTVFPFSFRLILESDLFVSVDDIKATNYTIQGLNSDDGGNVVFDTAPASGSTVLILRDIEFKRETEYQTLAKSVNRDFDRIWMAIQDGLGGFKRALQYSVDGKNYDAENRKIENLADPVNNQDAVNLQTMQSYMDTINPHLISGLAKNDGMSLIGDFKSMLELKNTHPLYTGQKVFLRSYYTDTLTGGGYFIGVINDTDSIDDGGYTSIRVDEKHTWKRVHNGKVNFYDGGARHDDFDNSKILKNIEISGLPLEIPHGYFTFKNGVKFTANKGISIYANGTFKNNSVFYYSPSSDDISEALIQVGEKNGETTYSGFKLHGITLMGCASEKHAICLYYTCHPEISCCEIVNFRGAGIFLDKCQDGVINFISIQKCGRSTGDYSIAEDMIDMNLTEYSPLHITTSIKNDASNMLRFEDLQIENNNCCPYIYANNGIGLWFSKIHSEHRTGVLVGAGGTWMRIGENHSSNTEVYLRDVQVSEFEWLVTAYGYGDLRTSGAGRYSGLRHVTFGVRFYLYANDSVFSKLSFSASVIARLSNIKTSSLTWSYASNVNYIYGSYINSLTMTNDGSSPNVNFIDCYFDSVIADTSNTKFIGGRCSGSFKYASKSGEGVVYDMEITGETTISVRYGTTYKPFIQTVYYEGTANQVINDDKFADGSEWFNTSAVNSGDIYMQKKINGKWVTLVKLP